MPVVIAHISDIHFEAREQRVEQPLIDAIRKTGPHFIVCTGDLVNQPLASSVSAAKSWIEKLVRECGVAEDKFLIIPGNHDYGFYGSVGVSFLSGRFFQEAFNEKLKDKVVSFAKEKLIFVLIDSNPTFTRLARGHVSRNQIKQLKKALAGVDLKIRNEATKIALIHHHCLPVYNEQSGDQFLLLDNSQAVMEFFADEGINLVLHGHKHRATHSMLSIGGVNVKNRIIEVLAAGTAMKSKDFEARGHNFNIITIDEFGFRSVTQYFSNPVGTAFIPNAPSHKFAFETFEELFQLNTSGKDYRVKQLLWELKVDLQGDRFNRMTYKGFSLNPAKPGQTTYTPPPYSVETGNIPENEVCLEDDSQIHLVKDTTQSAPRRVNFLIRFDEPPYQNPVDFTIQSWDLNACSLSEREFKIKHPMAQAPYLEHEEKTIDGATENFTWHLSFPERFNLGDIRFDVYDKQGESRQVVLTEILRKGFSFSYETNTACLNLHKPPSDYRYRISWRIAQNSADPLAVSSTTPESIPPAAQVDFQKLKQFLMKIRSQNFEHPEKSDEWFQAQATLLSYKEGVVQRIAALNAMNVEDIHLETGFMIYDESQQPGKLVTVIQTHPDPNLGKFALEYGDGNAGRAYKLNIARFWPSLETPEASADWYIAGVGDRHRFLCSIPVRDPRSSMLIIGILNIGSFDMPTANACCELYATDEAARLFDDANYMLTRLMQQANIWSDDQIMLFYGD